MPEEIKTESMELVVTACEKYSANNEVDNLYLKCVVLGIF